MNSNALLCVGMVILLCGCVSQAPTCNQPYILVGDGCCLDENADAICDSDKPLTTTAAPTTTVASTSTTSSTSTTATSATTTTIASTTLPSAHAVEYTNFTSQAYAVSLAYPITWGMTEQAAEDVIVRFYSPEDDDWDRGAAFVTVSDQRYVQMPTLASFKADANSKMRGKSVGYFQVSVDEVTVDGKKAFRHVYTTKPDVVTSKSMEYSVYGSGHIYTLSYDAPAELYDRYLPVFGNMTASFRIGGA
jgi:hypothetical protein